MIDLSIIIPSIRIEKWRSVIDSITLSCKKYSWEAIFIGPDADSVILNEDDRVSHYYSLSSPNVCQHKAMEYSKGKILHIFSDDCLFEEDAIDKCLDAKKSHAIVANYDEGGNCAVANFSLNYCYARTITPDSFVIFNTVFMDRNIFFQLGGFDCNFETICVAQADLAARWQFAGFTVDVENIKLSQCGHMPDTSGDHAPMHYAQGQNDIPMYINKYRIVPPLEIDFNNYKLQPTVWHRRFA